MEVKTVGIVCHMVYRVGYDKSTYAALEEQKRSINQAIELINRTSDLPQEARFCFTCAAAAPVYAYIRGIDESGRRQLQEVVSSNRMEICGLSHNLSAITGENEIKQSVDWLPAETWGAFHIQSVMQQAVGGMSQSAAAKLCKKGVKYVWAGLNGAYVHVHKPMPFYFNWRLSVKEKLFVWTDYIEHNLCNLLWEQGENKVQNSQIDCLTETKSLLDVDDADIVNMHAHLKNEIEKMEAEGLSISMLPVSFTGDFGCNRFASFEDLSEFVMRWNSMGLKPVLKITTLSSALSELSTELSHQNIPTYTGAWGDGLINGCASMPREISTYKDIQRLHKIVKKIVEPDLQTERILDGISRDLCIFAENTFACKQQETFSDFTTEYKKYKLHTSKVKLDYLYTDAVQGIFAKEISSGLYLFNVNAIAYEGVVRIPCSQIGDTFAYVLNMGKNSYQKLYYEDGFACFYVKLDAKEKAVFQFEKNDYIIDYNPISLPVVTTDSNGFPEEVVWSDGNKVSIPVFGELEVMFIDSRTPRDVVARIFYERSAVTRDSLITHYLSEYKTEYALTERIDRDYAILFKQEFKNAALRSGKRVITVWKDVSRVSVDICIDRLPNPEPQAIYAKFDYMQKGAVVSSAGGHVFEVGRGQISGTYADAVAVDGWVAYPYSNLLFMQKDTSVLSFGSSNFLANRHDYHAEGPVYACLFNNTVDESYQTDFSGKQTYSFDLFYQPCDDFYKDKLFTDAVYTEPVKYLKGLVK